MSLIQGDSDERMAQFVAHLNGSTYSVHGARFWRYVLDASAGKDQAANWLIEVIIVGSGARVLTLARRRPQ
ncbi:hypothetical protein KCP76_20480 [Salmonella enterica subsp. enterica serovar Weltevreden]|nr:hypothetical protein KCP76_20480 [Salmonella enterica subsp. enterica serovar Weltevreden]